MAIQKHNTYYDLTKPNSGIYCYDENGNHKEVLTKNDLNAISSISSINDKVNTLSGKTVSEIKSTETVTATPHTAPDGTIYYELEAAPEVSDTEIYGEIGISAKNQGTKWTIGLSADYLSANALNNLSGNWQNTFTAVTANSSVWNTVEDRVYSADFIPVKDDVDVLKTNSAHYPVESTNDFITVGSANHKFTLTFNSGDLVTSGWVEERLKDFGGFTTANPGPSGEPAVDEPSTKLIYLVHDISATGIDKYREWIYGTNSAWICIGDTSVDLEPLYELSGKFNEHSVNENLHIQGDERTKWNEVSAKLNKDDFNSWSAKTESWDISAYSGGFGIDVKDHTISLTENYLSANALDNLSGKWEKASDTLTASSGKWNDTYETVSANSAKWDKVDEKLDTSVFEAYTATADDIPYSGKNGIAIENHEVWISADYLSANALKELSGKWENASDVVNADSAKWNSAYSAIASANLWNVTYERVQASADEWDKVVNKLDKSESAKYMLVEKIDKTSDDKISGYNGSELYYPPVKEYSGKNGIKVEDYFIGIDSGWLDERYQEKGDYLSASEKFLSANALNNLSGNWESTHKTVSTNSATWEKVKDLHNVEISSTNGSIGITATTAVDGTVKYDLSVDEVEVQNISGYNGISARFNEETNQYEVGIENYNDIGFAKFSTSANVFTTSAVANGYNEDLNVNPTKITLDNDQILLKTGFYHIDVQTNLNVTTADNNCYDVLIKSIPNAASITQMIDASYAHNETVDLSFDVRITEDDTPIEISVENYKTNETFAITNLNIHEIVSMPSQIEGSSNNYQAGNGITITNDTIQAKLGNGLEFNESNAIQVKLGAGLKFDETQGVQSITIDSEVDEVVKTVDKLQEDLDTKITDNFPPAMITLADLQVATGTQYSPGNGGMLIGYLFTCPITHKIYSNTNNDYQTKIGIYTKQWSGDNKKVILGIYEFDPDYINPDTQQVGTTRALCDTGIIDLQLGYAEYEIKNLGNDTTHEMTPGKFYYATIYLSYLAGDTNGITLFGAPGYNTQVNNLKPGITITNVNKIKAALYAGFTGYSPNLNFDQMGFSWQYDSYPPDATTQDSSQYIVEANAAGRPYFAIRNVKK